MENRDILAAYKMIARELTETESQLAKFRQRTKELETQRTELKRLAKAFGEDVCPACEGYGETRVFVAQDESHFERCQPCKGTGLTVGIDKSWGVR